MPETNLSNSTTSSMNSSVTNFSVSPRTIDEAQISEQKWYNPFWSKYLGYYKAIPELKQAVDSLAMWTAGKGYTADNRTKAILEHISGWGEDSFDSIMQNLLVTKKINGDAFAERIVADDADKTLINLKPLNPSRIRTVVDPKGIIVRYEEWNPAGNQPIRNFKPDEIFHIVNNRIANEIHGVSVVESCQWVIDARNEAMSDWRRILHRSSIRVMYVDIDDTSKLTVIKTQYADAIKNGEVLILPVKKGDAELVDYSAPPLEAFLGWIRYLENFFYQAVGVPKVILGGSQEFTEASSKVGYLTFEQVYATEQRLLEQDLWNQLAIKITFERPVSLKEDVLTSEAANTGQVGFQPNEVNASMTKNE